MAGSEKFCLNGTFLWVIACFQHQNMLLLQQVKVSIANILIYYFNSKSYKETKRSRNEQQPTMHR